MKIEVMFDVVNCRKIVRDDTLNTLWRNIRTCLEKGKSTHVIKKWEK